MASPLEQPPPPSGPVGTPGSASAPPSLQSLSGGGSGQPQPGDQSIQIVTQHLMEAEQALQAAAKIKPELAGIVDTFINTVKPQAGQILFGAGQGGQAAPATPGAGAGIQMPSPTPTGGGMNAPPMMS